MFPGETGEDFDCLFPLLGPMVGTRSGCVSSVLESSVGAEDEENSCVLAAPRPVHMCLGWAWLP